MTDMDAETRKFCAAYDGPDFDKPRIVKIEVMEEWGGDEWSLEAFRKLIDDAIEEIPVDKRSETRVELCGGGDEGPSRLLIWYMGLEDEATVQARVDRCIAVAEKQKACERRTYDALKAKFENAKIA